MRSLGPPVPRLRFPITSRMIREHRLVIDQTLGHPLSSVPDNRVGVLFQRPSEGVFGCSAIRARACAVLSRDKERKLRSRHGHPHSFILSYWQAAVLDRLPPPATPDKWPTPDGPEEQACPA